MSRRTSMIMHAEQMLEAAAQYSAETDQCEDCDDEVGYECPECRLVRHARNAADEYLAEVRPRVELPAPAEPAKSAPSPPVLTDKQLDAIGRLEFGVLDKQVQTLGGYAGTGKSTLLAEMIRRLPRFAVCAYTGKAAQVLRRKGIHEAATIHSTIYKPKGEGKNVRFVRNSRDEMFVRGFLVDEASMVGRDIHEDLLSFDLPIIYFGDHGQLEPVGADGFNLMQQPDVVLEEIHRNAGVIARFAEHLRFGNDAASWDPAGQHRDGEPGVVDILQPGQLADLDFNTVDQMICAYNKTRVDMNRMIRDAMGMDPAKPQVGDRIMCLQNDREFAVFNGMQGVITDIDHGWGELTFDFYGRSVGPVRYHKGAFDGGKGWRRQKGIVPFDYAYCVTCHKAQGDEWDHVLVLEQRCDLWQHSRWAYTAASRAKKRLSWVL
jgi:exodeoxyribonuclease-5